LSIIVHHSRVSPVSRGRKRAKSKRSGLRVVRPAVTDVCDCPSCSGVDLDPDELVGSLLSSAAELAEVDDPLDVELFGGTLLVAGQLADGDLTEALSNGLVPAVAELATAESVAVLLALDAVDGGLGAADAAERLIRAGVPAPAWASELREPVKLGQCQRLVAADADESLLMCTFERAGRSHGFLTYVDHADCDAAMDIMLFPVEFQDEILGEIRKEGPAITTEILEPAEFRWQVEHVLDARTVHDRDGSGPELPDGLSDAEKPYHLLAALLRTRMRTLPEPSRPPAQHGAGSDRNRRATLELLAQLQAGTSQRGGFGSKLPAKRKKSDPAAPIYQIKVGLRGAKPPIWRRLEVPANTSLARLHDIIQVAFGWADGHLHVFETAYGDFGVADREMGHRAEAPVTLEQVAPGVGDRLQYTYDFGDDWTHEIVVEKVLDRQPGAYPRCTGGRRAAPPEDCGGIWGYTELLEVLSDPDHPEHEERLEWLGLDSPADFQPDRFNAAEITRMLTRR